MEAYFRYVAILSLLFRLGVTFYIASREAAASGAGVTGPASNAVTPVRRRFAPPHLVLFSNIWLTIGLTFWVTALLVDREYSIS